MLAHPYDGVRMEVARTLAFLVTFDIPFGRKQQNWNLGKGFPRLAYNQLSIYEVKKTI